MPFRARSLCILIPALMLGCASGPSGQSFESPLGNWTEKYVKASGRVQSSRLTIVQNGGRYSDSFSTRVVFSDKEDPRIWKGIWIQDGRTGGRCLEEIEGSKYWGEMVFQFNETYSEYTGTSDYCGEGKKDPISGYR